MVIPSHLNSYLSNRYLTNYYRISNSPSLLHNARHLTYGNGNSVLAAFRTRAPGLDRDTGTLPRAAESRLLERQRGRHELGC